MLPKILYNADEVINELSSLAKNKNLVFRGYGKQTELYPNIIRNGDLTNREIELLINFMTTGLRLHSITKTELKQSISPSLKNRAWVRILMHSLHQLECS